MKSEFSNLQPTLNKGNIKINHPPGKTTSKKSSLFRFNINAGYPFLFFCNIFVVIFTVNSAFVRKTKEDAKGVLYFL